MVRVAEPNRKSLQPECPQAPITNNPAASSCTCSRITPAGGAVLPIASKAIPGRNLDGADEEHERPLRELRGSQKRRDRLRNCRLDDDINADPG